MATAQAQRKWRDKHWFVKRQLNVMARRLVHEYLDEISASFVLKGKAEAVTFACFVTKALMQRADFNADAARMLDQFIEAYKRDRDIYAQ